MQTSLPIWQIHPQIVGALQSGNRLVLIAPTGSGKTTQVPQMLLDGHVCGGRIVVLQPRRVAARTVAARVAWERGGKLGGEIGYQIRFEDRTGLGTRICFVTEGILLRWLQDDPALREVGAILFDEFHERNLLGDVALALAKRLQETQRPDLKIVVMSATLDAESVADYLEGCLVLVSEGKMFPVQIHYSALPDERPVSEQAGDLVAQIVQSGDPGDILVFMPGMGEINATIGACRAAETNERLALIPLHGELPPEEQDAAFAPNRLRKVVVATNVAETSVTIDGILHVIDSGLARIARYDAERGIGTLSIEAISRASAEQRAGRAGRTAPGTCHRLWTEGAHLNRPERNTPEIQRSDLAEVVLLLHSFGIKDAAHFEWLDRPDVQAVERAEKLLRTLGALRSDSNVQGSDMTPIGWQMLRLPMHPRYSRMLVEALRRGCVAAAALCASLVSGRDLLMRLGRDDKHIAEARELFEASADSDFYTLMRAYQFARNNHFNVEQCRRYGVHAQIARQVQQTYDQIEQAAARLDKDGKSEDAPATADDALLRCIMAGFIDQLCKRRDQGTLDCDLTEGRSGTLVRESVVQSSPLFVAASVREVSGRTGQLTVLGLATVVKREWIEEMFPNQLTRQIEHLFDRTHKRVSAVLLLRFHDLVIHFEHQREVDSLAAGQCLAAAFAKQYFELPLLNHEIKQLMARINLICAVMPELDFPPADAAFIQSFLSRAFAGLTLVKEAQATPLRDAFLEEIGPERLEWLNELAPQTITWPDGKKLKLLYPDAPLDDDNEPNSPELQVKLHEAFALKTHPHICEGRQPIKLWLCAPDGKRLEPTHNWPAFRLNTYPKLKTTLQQKFPGLLWP
ncbi:MAG TPA: ATP-dependent helicase C-terminal domain-containing protein [Candidatus Saccharimonadales bacterium]|nr:ATP-dependent helicase C-terminal domain-containing protein [Candidatus Saccharimonadales bacterium]